MSYYYFFFSDELECCLYVTAYWTELHSKLTFQMFLLKKKNANIFLINFGDALTVCPRAGQGEVWSNLCWHTERQRQQINRLSTYKLRIIDLIIYWHKNIYLVIFFRPSKKANKIYMVLHAWRLWRFFLKNFFSS